MNSQARPKKITLMGTDGKAYSFLCKRESKGDMRKDQRLMDLCAVINRLLSKFPDSRSRNLQLCTFAVITLTEKVGMLEWVENVDTLRRLLQKTFRYEKRLLESMDVELSDLTMQLRIDLQKYQTQLFNNPNAFINGGGSGLHGNNNNDANNSDFKGYKLI